VLVAGQVHAQDRVVVIRRELGPGRVDELLHQLIDVDAARADLLDADALGDVARLGLAGRVRFRTRSHYDAPSKRNKVRTGLHSATRCLRNSRAPGGAWGGRRYIHSDHPRARPQKMLAVRAAAGASYRFGAPSVLIGENDHATGSAVRGGVAA